MKMEKWNMKVSAKLDKMLDDGKRVLYENADGGVYFGDKSGTWILFLDGKEVWTAKKGDSRSLKRYFDYSSRRSTLASFEKGEVNGKKARRFSNGETDVYVYEKLVRQFPANALFYISSPVEPVYVGIWENDRLHQIGLVCPFHIRSNTFCAS